MTVQHTYRCLRLGIVLHSGADDPACVRHDRLVFRLEQFEQGVPQLQDRHVVGVVDQLDELPSDSRSVLAGGEAHHLEIVECLYSIIYAVRRVQRDRHLLLHDQAVTLAEDMIQHLAREVRSLRGGRGGIGRSGSLM